MNKMASISTNLKRNPIKTRFLMGTMLSAVVWGSVQATPLDDKALVVAQAPPQSEQEDKKQAPQRPGQQQKQQRRTPGGTEATTGCAGAARVVRRNVRCSRHPRRVATSGPSAGAFRCSRHPHRVGATSGPSAGTSRCSRHPHGDDNLPGRRRERQVQPPPTPGGGCALVPARHRQVGGGGGKRLERRSLPDGPEVALTRCGWRLRRGRSCRQPVADCGGVGGGLK